ncbi:hypothetical protein LCGC14_1916330 [marine sediment metagenome]|uniref:Uncharacterized protein n=1 Tax=marine sediment metagenome TaxID=412755 RepID=A0A0F9FRZ4_9ZZZZ
MPRQVYRCPEHGEFEVETKLTEDVETMVSCPTLEYDLHGLVGACNSPSPWVPSAPNFIGGPTTGAECE